MARGQCATRRLSKPRLPERPGTNSHPRKPPRQAGQRWSHVRPPRLRCPGRHTCDLQPRGKHQQPSERPQRWEVRSREETEKSQASAKPDIPLGTQTSAGRRPAAVGGGKPGGRPRREKEARLLNLRRDRSELRHSGAHHVTNGVVTQNLVAAAGEGMVSPAVKYLTAHGASRVMIPKRHAEAALQSSTKEGGRDMGVSRRRTGGEPGPSTRNAAGVEVQTAVAREGGVSENARHGLGLDLARQRLLRWGIALSINVGTGRNDAPEGALGSGKVAPIVKVKGVKVRPEEAAQIAAGGETGHTRRRGVLSSTPGTQTTRRDAKRRQAPVIVREGAPNQMTESRANITIGSVETPEMSIRQCDKNGGPWTNPSKSEANRRRPVRQETCQWRPRGPEPYECASQADPHTTPTTREESREA